MSTVVMHNVVSVDGYIADENDDIGPLFEFYSNGDVDLGFAKVTRASADYLRPSLEGIGALVVGRHVFDITNGWQGVPPAGSGHVVVVSQGIVDRQPRLGNASIIGVAGRRVRVSSTARMKVLAHLIENGDCQLSDLASTIAADHPDPYGAILNLVSNDVLRIDLAKVLSPTSMVGLAGDDVEMSEL